MNYRGTKAGPLRGGSSRPFSSSSYLELLRFSGGGLHRLAAWDGALSHKGTVRLRK